MRLDGTPVTSAGVRFPGNRHQVTGRLAMDRNGPELTVSSQSSTCAEGQQDGDCEAVPDPAVLTPVGTPAVSVWGDGRFGVVATFAVAPDSQAAVNPRAWGTIRLSGAWAPGRVGAPSHDWSLERSSRLTVREDHALNYGNPNSVATAPVWALTLGPSAALPTDARSYVSTTYSRTVTASAPA